MSGAVVEPTRLLRCEHEPPHFLPFPMGDDHPPCCIDGTPTRDDVNPTWCVIDVWREVRDKFGPDYFGRFDAVESGTVGPSDVQ